MASNNKKEPISLLKRTWDNNIKLPEKYKFRELIPRTRQSPHWQWHTWYGVFLKRTLPAFNKVETRLNWRRLESISEFKNVLGDVYCTTWLEILTNHFHEPLENKPKATCESKNCNKNENFYRAISIFLCKILGDQKPCNQQYIYM